MSALTAYTKRRARSGGFSWHQNWRVLDAGVIFLGSFCGVPGASALTAGRGYARAYTNQQTIQWIGVAIRSSYESAADRDLNQVTGVSAGAPPPEVWCEGGPVVLEQVAVTGVSAQGDVHRRSVYASNDNDLTITASQSPAVGRIVYWYSSTTCDVLMYGYLSGVVI